MAKLQNANLLEVARGAIGERLAYELAKVVDNINDLNTKPNAARKLQLTITFKPDSERKQIQMSTQVKSTLVPTNEIETALFLTEHNGGAALVEMVPQVPGQLAIDGTEEEQPKVIDIWTAVKMRSAGSRTIAKNEAHICRCRSTATSSLFSIRPVGTLGFSTHAKAKEAIEAFRDELMWYFTEYRSRLDEKRTEAAE